MRENDLHTIKQCVEQIRIPADAADRICNLDERKKYHHIRHMKYTRSLVACVVLSIICAFFIPYSGSKEQGLVVNVYAAEQGTGNWARLSPNEKIYLNEAGNPVPAGYMFQLELPEHYQYRQSCVIMGNNTIGFLNDTNIFWNIGSQDKTQFEYEIPDYLTSSIEIKIFDDNDVWIQTLNLELTKDGENYYAELTYEDK